MCGSGSQSDSSLGACASHAARLSPTFGFASRSPWRYLVFICRSSASGTTSTQVFHSELAGMLRRNTSPPSTTSASALDFGRGSPVEAWLPSDSVRFLVTGLLFSAVNSLLAISPFGRLSGAHLNPAVTLAFGVLGRVSAYDIGGYVLAQIAGAVAGATALRLLWGSVAESIDGGVTLPTVSVPVA